MYDILIRKLNNTYVQIVADKSILYEISDMYTFESPNAKFDKRVRNGIWDGKIRLFVRTNNTLPLGLLNHLKIWMDEQEYTYYVEGITENDALIVSNFVDSWINTLPEDIGGVKFEKRKFQIDAIKHAITTKRCLIESPTSSGKSLIIYGICSCTKGKKLIIVPTTTLVGQMADDFHDYGYNKDIADLYFNSTNKQFIADKHDICISTWQSLQNASPNFFKQFNVVIGDEAHQAGAKEVKKQIESCINAEYKIGTTGTIPPEELLLFTLYGLFGDVYTTISLREMIDNGYCSDVTIYAVIVKYSNELKKQYKQNCFKFDRVKNITYKDYPKEVDWLSKLDQRNKIISAINEKCNGNTLILFKNREAGKHIEKYVSKSSKTIHYVDGTVDTKKRKEIRKNIESSDNNTFIASFKTSGTGMSVKRLHNMIIGSPSKSPTQVPQLLGRGLRLGSDKTHLNMYDIGDCIYETKDSENYTWTHFKKRIKMYLERGLNVKYITVEIK